MSDLKRMAAIKAVEFVREGMIVGLGTGSTARFAVDEIGRKVKEGMHVVGIPTSKETERQARELGIPLTTLEEVERVDLTIDGADEVDPQLRLIKGLGGALLREKMVAFASLQEIIIVDQSKEVEKLGVKMPIPVEAVPFSHKWTKRSLERLGCTAFLRGGEKPFITDNGNLIYDCKFPGIDNPEELEMELNRLPGVVENGLFLGLATCVMVGANGGVVVRKSNAKRRLA